MVRIRLRHKMLALAGVAAATVAVAACSSDEAATPTPGPTAAPVTVVVTATPTAVAQPTATARPEPAPASKSPAGSLRIGIQEVAAGIGLNSAGSVSGSCQQWGCSDGLFTWSAANREEPELVESWTLAPDQSSVTIKIRKDSKFHTVEKDWGGVKAQDIAWGYNEMNPSINAESIGWSAANLSATFGKNPVEALDDYTLKFTFLAFDVRWANSTLNESGQVGYMTLPKAAFDEKGKDWMRTHIVSNGPYMVKEWVQDDHVTLEAVTGHYKYTPKIKTVTMVRLQEQATRVAAMRTGELDGAELDAKTFKDMLNRGFKHFGAGNDHQLGIFWAGNQWETVNANDGTPLPSTGNCTRNLLWIGCPGIAGDMEQARIVRHAVSIAIDREAINKSVVAGLGYPNHVTWWDIKNPNWQSKWEYKYDPAAAAKELDDINIKPNDGVRFEMPIWSGPGLPGEVGDAVAGFLSDIGIQSEVLKYQYIVYRPGIVARTNNVPFLTECDDGYSPLPWDLPKGLVASSLTWGGFSCGFGAKEIADAYTKMGKEPDVNKRIQLSNELLDYIYQWNLITGLIVEPQTLTVNPNAVKDWPMRPTVIGSWTELYNAVPAK